MRFRHFIFRTLIIISLIFLICPPVLKTVNAAGLIDTSRSDGSLSLFYKDDEVLLHDVTVRIYKIASVNESGAISLTSDYLGADLDDDFPGSAHDNSDIYAPKQQSNALSLSQYIKNHSYDPLNSGQTDASGGIRFDSLKAGVYLIISDSIEYSQEQRYNLYPFFVCLPYLDSTDIWKYDVTAYPKCFRRPTTQNPGSIKSKIIKSWMNDNEADRPQEIKVQILKNNELFNEINLSSSNNWVYEWTMLNDPDIVWSVKELDVPSKYTVSYVTLTSTKPPNELDTDPKYTFFIINEIVEEPLDDVDTPDNPYNPDRPGEDNNTPGKKIIDDIINWIKTSDMLSIAWLTTLLSGSGLIILFLGIRRKIHFGKSGADTNDK